MTLLGLALLAISPLVWRALRPGAGRSWLDDDRATRR